MSSDVRGKLPLVKIGTLLLLVSIIPILGNADSTNANNGKESVPASWIARKARLVDSLKAVGFFQNSNITPEEEGFTEPTLVGIKASANCVSWPAEIRKLYVATGENSADGSAQTTIQLIDSITFTDGRTEAANNSVALPEVVIDESLFAGLQEIGAISIRRSIPWQPGRQFSYINPYGQFVTKDLSVYYHIQLDGQRMNAHDAIEELEKYNCIEKVYRIGKIIDFDDPPDTSGPQCQFDDDSTAYQWYLRADSGGIDAFGAWDLLCDSLVYGDSVVIAIEDNFFSRPTVDSVIHSELIPNLHPSTRLHLQDFYDPQSQVNPDFSHGTNVAGIVGAAAMNDIEDSNQTLLPSGPEILHGKGIVGVYPSAKLILLSHNDDPEDTTAQEVLDNLYYLCDSTSVKVINFSWGSDILEWEEFTDLLDYAFYEKGILLVAAAGNCELGCPDTTLPAVWPSVIAVGTSGKNRSWDSLSTNWGYIDFLAPGETIFTTGGFIPNDEEELEDTIGCSECSYLGYSWVSGTSFAAPMVTATIGLILTAHPTISPYSVYGLLAETADSVAGRASGYNGNTGWGIINAGGAVSRVLNGLHCTVVNGDINDDCYVNYGDLLYLINYLYHSGPTPPHRNHADVNHSCNINVLDMNYLIAYLFTGGSAPLAGCVE